MKQPSWGFWLRVSRDCCQAGSWGSRYLRTLLGVKGLLPSSPTGLSAGLSFSLVVGQRVQFLTLGFLQRAFHNLAALFFHNEWNDLGESQHLKLDRSWKWYIIYHYLCSMLLITQSSPGILWEDVNSDTRMWYQEVGSLWGILEASSHSESIVVYVSCNSLGLWRGK